MRVLLVQGCKAGTFVPKTALASAGYVVDRVADADDALGSLGVYEYDIVVLDRMPSGIDGCRIIHRMRSRRIDTPVLMLVARDSNGIAVTALRAGADDVLTHPLADDELLARIEAIVRRRNGHAQSILQVGSLTIDMNSHEVAVAGRPVHLSNKEFGVLLLLILRRGTVVSKEKIFNFLYDGLNDPNSRTIEVYVCCLRKKLAKLDADVTIDTVMCAGYILRDGTARQNDRVLDRGLLPVAPPAVHQGFRTAMAA